MPEVSRDSPLGAAFALLAESGRRAFIPFVTAGHPAPQQTSDVLSLLADSGADIIELGIPFGDPLADGPTIQAASWRALAAGVDVARVFAWTEEFRARYSVPIVLFTYLNPVLAYGPDRFVGHARDAGASGILITDLPVGADDELDRRITGGGLDLVRLIAPTTPADRAARIAAAARGFIYYISRTGVTGARDALPAELTRGVEAVRRLTDLPIAVGFGISAPRQARLVAELADGVVVGSALVQSLDEGGLEATGELARTLRRAIDDATRR